MNDDGFTLAEMLVGLLLASVALSALAVAGRTVARTERQVAAQTRTARQLDRVRRDLGEAIAVNGPLRGDGVRGAAQGVTFACGGVHPCRATLEGAERDDLAMAFTDGGGAVHRYPLPALARVRFGYVAASGGTAREAWSSDDDDRLAAVVLFAGERPVAVFPASVEQSGACAFDLSRADCRTSAP